MENQEEYPQGQKNFSYFAGIGHALMESLAQEMVISSKNTIEKINNIFINIDADEETVDNFIDVFLQEVKEWLAKQLENIK